MVEGWRGRPRDRPNLRLRDSVAITRNVRGGEPLAHGAPDRVQATPKLDSIDYNVVPLYLFEWLDYRPIA